MFPPLTDFFAMASVAVVLCAACLYLREMTSSFEIGANAKSRWLAGLCFAAMWLPLGSTMLPIVAYVRGFTADFSISSLVLASLSLCIRLFGLTLFKTREFSAVFFVSCAAALVLYPLALGWGDWDAYSPGWGSFGIWTSLLVLCFVFWICGLRLLPLIVGLALLSWTAGLLESTNLWDYLLDPWLGCGAIFFTMRAAARQSKILFSADRA